jgi:type III secretory pathway lipoprotein EscJ
VLSKVIIVGCSALILLFLYKKKDNNKHTYYFFDFLLSKKTNKTIFLFVISKKHFMKSIISDLTSETIGIIFKECEKDKNKKRLEVIMNNIINIAFENLKPYLYTIMGLLMILFLINCFQFYYYVKLFINNNKLDHIQIEDILTIKS